MTEAMTPAEGQEPTAGADSELLVLIDRLADLLHRSDLTELEVESGGTGLVLRKAVAAPAGAPPGQLAPTDGATAGVDSAGLGGEVAVGQVIGLIEAMKLFNEIKSDLAGRVLRVVPESGALVKAKQPLIEVEPL
jgi:acetyl/propionyl-CoA carboxylase alpha subunit